MRVLTGLLRLLLLLPMAAGLAILAVAAVGLPLLGVTGWAGLLWFYST